MSCVSFLKAQVISKFTWDSNPVTMSVIGPTATSVGLSATSSTGGVGGTNGLNPGAPTANDINLNIPNTSGIFDIPNIDISIDYRRNESTAQMIKRGTFTFNNGGASGSFQVVFRVGSGTVVTSSAIAIPQDATFRNYRFTYDNCSGVGTMYINNSSVWSSPTPTVNQNLYWSGDGNIVIGQDMDGANNNVPNLDNFILQPYTCSTLPIELISFTGMRDDRKNILEWATATEHNNNFFTVERSGNGIDWLTISKVYGAGNSTTLKAYQTEDKDPGNGINYYRLTQTDFDGQEKKFSIVSIDNSSYNSITILKTVDFLGREVGNEYEGLRLVFYSDGTVIKKTGK